MKKMIFLIFSILTLTMSCNNKHTFGQSFNLTSINIDLHIKELINPATKVKLTHAVKYRGEFYCFFEEVFKDYSTRDSKFCFVFSDKGKNLKKIQVPDVVQNTVYFDLFVIDDNMFLKTDMDNKTFYYNYTKSKWVKTKNAEDLIFEDEKFYVYSLDFGEWGGKTWFKDKKTGIEYEIEATTPLVNKIDNDYYLTSSFMVLKIDNPLTLNKCESDVTYENIEKSTKYTSWYGKPIGFEIVYEDTMDHNNFDFSYKPHIVSSFVWQNELLHVYETDTATYISKVNNNEITPIKKIGDKLHFYNWAHSYRKKIQKDGLQILKFKVNHNFGLMEIKDQDIITYNLILK
jgi:hypothetical protein